MAEGTQSAAEETQSVAEEVQSEGKRRKEGMSR
jgi:hypothetical protein